jgi:hypothetical protein
MMIPTGILWQFYSYQHAAGRLNPPLELQQEEVGSWQLVAGSCPLRSAICCTPAECKKKELAEKEAALRGLRQALVSTTDQAKHWRQQAGVWQAHAERSAERVKELTEHVQAASKFRKVLEKKVEEMKVCYLGHIE